MANPEQLQGAAAFNLAALDQDSILAATAARYAVERDTFGLLSTAEILLDDFEAPDPYDPAAHGTHSEYTSLVARKVEDAAAAILHPDRIKAKQGIPDGDADFLRLFGRLPADSSARDIVAAVDAHLTYVRVLRFADDMRLTIRQCLGNAQDTMAAAGPASANLLAVSQRPRGPLY